MEKVKILFVHFGDQWIRGSERVLIDLINNLKKDEFEVVLWTNVVALADVLQNRSIKIIVSEFEYYLDYDAPPFNIWKYIGIIREGIRMIKKENIAVIHSNGAAPAQWLVPTVWWTKRPLLTHIHTTYLRRSRVVSLLHQSDRVIGVASSVFLGAIQNEVPKRKREVILNGSDLSRFTGVKNRCLKSSLGLRDDNFLLGGVGSLIDRKGWDVALRALPLVDREIHLCIAGDGPTRDKLVALSIELEISDRVHFLGVLDDPGIVYEAADIIVMPSRMEAFGLVAVEAGYFGNPVIASDVGGLSEVIQDRVTGLLVRPDDPAVLANAILELRNNVELLEKLGLTAKKTTEYKFSARQMSIQFESEYRHLSKRSYGRVMRIAGAIRSYTVLARSVCFQGTVAK